MRLRSHLSSIFVLAISLVMLQACAGYGLGKKSLSLRVGMSEQEVRQLLGDPVSTSQSTCGQDTGQPWSCLTWNYDEYGGKYVTFSNGDGVLHLNHWKF